MIITEEITKAFEQYLNEIIDHDVRGTPIYRKDLGSMFDLTPFAAGYIKGKEING